MRRAVVAASIAIMVLATASPAWAEPDILKWLKDPCVPTGDMENDCQLPPLP